MATNTTLNVNGPNDAGSLGDKVANLGSEVKDKVTNLGHAAADKVDENRGAAASKLEGAAAALQSGTEKVTGVANATADKLNSTADYVRRNDVSSMVGDLKQFFKNNPGASLLGAAAIGFLVGRAFGSDE